MIKSGAAMEATCRLRGTQRTKHLGVSRGGVSVVWTNSRLIDAVRKHLHGNARRQAPVYTKCAAELVGQHHFRINELLAQHGHHCVIPASAVSLSHVKVLQKHRILKTYKASQIYSLSRTRVAEVTKRNPCFVSHIYLCIATASFQIFKTLPADRSDFGDIDGGRWLGQPPTSQNAHAGGSAHPFKQQN